MGIWMAAATLLAIFLAAHRLTSRILGLPVGWAAAGLTVVTLLCQSVGAIILLLFFFPLALLKRRSVLRASIAILIAAILAFTAFRMSNLVSLRALAHEDRAARSLSGVLTSIGRHSLAWRFARDEGHVAVALQKPLLGWGQWNWWQNGDSRPWSLWLLVFGMYGLVGLMAIGTILFLPIIRATWAESNSSEQPGLRMALAATILMLAIDSLLNGALILPYLLIAGGLAAGSKHRKILE